MIMSKGRSRAFLLIASVLQAASGDFIQHGQDAERLRMRSVQVGTSYCTDAPSEECYPSTGGFPACCDVPETCPGEKQPCEDGTPVANPTTPTLSPAPTPSGGEPGDSYCEFAPDFDCYPATGYPACCADDPDTCPVSRPACDEDEVGASYCTYAPDFDCYVEGWPMCCREDNGADCPAEQPPCDSASDVPSMVPTPASSAGSATTLPTPEVAGGTTTSPTGIPDSVTLTGAPSPAPSPESPTGGGSTTSSAVAVAWTAPAVALAVTVAVNIAHLGFN